MTHSPGPKLIVLAQTAENEMMPYKWPVVEQIGTMPDGQPIVGKTIAYATTEEYARLIAQAPAMLTYLNKLVGPHKHWPDGGFLAMMDEARAILRVIEGK